MAGFSATACLPVTAVLDVMAALGGTCSVRRDSDSHWDQGYFWDSWCL
jgi:hypothetical protein